MLLRAGWGERAWDGEEDGFLSLGEVGDGGGFDLAGVVEVGEGGIGELVADGDGGGDGGGGGEFEGLEVNTVVVGFEGEFEREGFRWEERRCCGGG